MDKLGDRDLVLLRRRSDVDYVDVFGGPPMRSYSYEHRRSLASCRPQPSSRLVLASEKPAFGELSDPTQRRHLGDDFFSDIFPGSDSHSSMQWNLDHSPFLSPLTPHLSHPQVKLAKGLDHPLFGSLLCYDADKRYRDVLDASTFPHSLIANQVAPDDLRNGYRAFYHQSLSSQSFHGNQSGRCAASLKGYEELAREHVIANRSQRASENDVKVEVQDQRQNYVEPFDTVGPRVKDCLPLKDEMHGNKVRGRVKEFIEIFKFEGSTKFKSIYVGGKRKSTEKSSLKSKIDVKVNNSTPKPDAEMKVAPCTIEVTLDVGSANVQTSFEDKAPSTYISSNVHITNSSSEKNNTLGPSSDSTEESIEKYHLEDLDGCLVEQLSQELTETQQVGFIQNQIYVANAKIMEWSKGKEGNIRSLLSTLQYVLWTESGWKPIRLSDIIEGTSVKKAYQKALLCLHPDKLQQRSAAEHEKYIAEKVFGILQESWNQFNSVSLF